MTGILKGQVFNNKHQRGRPLCPPALGVYYFGDFMYLFIIH